MTATPTRLGQLNNAGDDKALFLKLYAETLAAFRRTTQFSERHYVRKVSGQKSAQFPLTGRAGAQYHTPGSFITGQAIPQNEKVITIDGVLISPVEIAEIDQLMNHYEVRREFTAQLGESLAQNYDLNVARTGILAARSTGWHSSMPGGTALEAANVKTNAADLIANIFQAGVIMDENYIPEMDCYAFVKPLQHSFIAQNATYQNKDIGGAGAYLEGGVPRIGRFRVVKTNNLPTTNVGGTFSNKYDVNATTTAALCMHRTAVGTVQLMNMKMESEWDIRRQVWLLLAKQACGHGVLRPECAVEIRTGAPV